MGGFKPRGFREIEKRIDFAPQRAPIYARCRHGVARDVTNAIRWALAMATAWDGRERATSAMAGVEGVIVVGAFFMYLRARVRANSGRSFKRAHYLRTSMVRVLETQTHVFVRPHLTPSVSAS